MVGQSPRTITWSSYLVKIANFRTWEAVFAEGGCEGYFSCMRHCGHWVYICDTIGRDSRIDDITDIHI